MAAGVALGLFIGLLIPVAQILIAAAAATLVYTLAAENAAARSEGPGSFAVALLDALAAIRPEALPAGARLEAAVNETAGAAA